MSLLDTFLGKLGLVRKSQVNPLDPNKPNFMGTNPDGTTKDSSDQSSILDQNNQQDVSTNGSIGTQPQNLVGDPAHTQNKEVNQQPIQPPVSVQTPFDRVQDSTGKSPPPQNPNQLNNAPLTKPMYTREEVDQMFHPSVAIKLHQKGIKTVDKAMFDEKYNLVLKRAALEKKSVSELLDENKSTN